MIGVTIKRPAIAAQAGFLIIVADRSCSKILARNPDTLVLNIDSNKLARSRKLARVRPTVASFD